MREYGHECYNSFDYFIYFSLSSNTYLYLFATQLSLSLLSGLHLSVAPYFFLTFIFLYLSLSFSLSAFRYYHHRSNPSLRPSLSLSLSFPVIVSLSFFSCHKEEGDSDLKHSLPIEARQFEPLLADLKLCLPRGNCRSLLVILQALTADGWLSLVIDWSVGLGFCWRFWVFILFYFLFCWGFLIWNLLEDSMIVVVVCCGGCSSGC